MRVNFSFLKLVVLLALLHVYIGLRLLPDLPSGGAARIWGASILLLCCMAIPLNWVSRTLPQQHADRLAWVGLLALGWFSSLLVLTFLRDLTLSCAYFMLPPAAYNAYASVSAMVVAFLSVLVTVLGFFNARRVAAVVDVDIPLPQLAPALQGFTIAQLSDIHIGPTIKHDYLDAIVDAVNVIEPDVIAITGDLVDGSVTQLAGHIRPLERLRARHGVFFVTGNHDYYSGEREWTRELQKLGVRVLKNEHVVLRHGDAAIVLAGVTDYGAHHFDPAQRSDPFKALAGAPSDASPRVLLAHQPRSAERAAEAGFDLQLSGHTHGGQFWPWNHFVRFQQPYTAGLHRLQRMWVYTSRGTGYWGPPKRFGAPSEITRIRLVAALP